MLEFSHSVLESSSDLSYVHSLSQHGHLLAGKRLFLLVKDYLFLFMGKNVEPLFYQMWFLSLPGKLLFSRFQLLLNKGTLSLQRPQNI